MRSLALFLQAQRYFWHLQPSLITHRMDQMTKKTPNPKCRLFLKIDLGRGLAAGVYLSEAPWGGKAICWFGIWSSRYTVYSSCTCCPHNPIIRRHLKAVLWTRRIHDSVCFWIFRICYYFCKDPDSLITKHKN
jgi:hypothetical protein